MESFPRTFTINFKTFGVTTCLIISALQTASGYKTCTSTQYDFNGYTHRVDLSTSQKIWTHCQFPNPLIEPTSCGRRTSDVENYVCDPDHLLNSAAEGVTIDRSLYNVQTETQTICFSDTGEKESFIIGVLLIKRIRMPDFQSPEICVNDCGEIHPALDTSVRVATGAEERANMEHFAFKIRERWSLGSCDNDVIVFYSQYLNKVEISIGSRAKHYLPDSKIGSMKEEFMRYVNSDRLEDGLLNLIELLKQALMAPLTPAQILLIIGMIIMIFVGVFLVYFLMYGDKDMNIWGYEQPVTFIQWFLSVLMGLWLAKMAVIGIMFMSFKLPHWTAGLLLLTAISMFTLYGVEKFDN